MGSGECIDVLRECRWDVEVAVERLEGRDRVG